MKHVLKITAVILLFVMASGWLLYGANSSNAQEEAGDSLQPITNNGEKWRIGYVETDPYINFAGTFHGLIRGLERIGWLEGTEQAPFETGQDDSKELWHWLASEDVGPYIEFVADAHYSLIDEPDLHEKVLDRLQNEQDLDLILLLGTSPGQLIATDAHSTPALVFSSSNAVISEIIESEHDSGIDHVWAHMDAYRYKRQVEVFHDIFHFEKLAMVYEDSVLGRVYAAVADVEELARDRNFEIIHYHVDEPVNQSDRARYEQEMNAAFQQAALEADAFYLTAGIVDLDKLSALLKPFYENSVPIFSRIGAGDVSHGALMSLYSFDFSGIGQFGAEVIARVLLGEKPREQSQIYGDTPNIVLNLEVADRIDYRVPFDILLVADWIYHEIEGGQAP